MNVVMIIQKDERTRAVFESVIFHQIVRKNMAVVQVNFGLFARKKRKNQKNPQKPKNRPRNSNFFHIFDYRTLTDIFQSATILL